MKYPFTPELLDALPEELAELFRELEAFMLGEICDRLKLSEKLNEVTVQDIRVLRSHGIDLEAIKKAIAETSEVSLDKVNALLDDVVQRNQTYFDDLVSLAQVTKPQRYIDESDVEAIRQQTLGEFKNLTQSLGFLVTQNGKRVMLEPAEAYQWALYKAETHIMSGGVSYNQAIRDAVKELADSGIQRVDYESGHTDHADVAARRAIMTGVNQLCDKYVESSAEYLETDHFEVSAHIGARDVDGHNGWENHKAWQGKVYSVRSLDKYPSIYEVCGLGDVTGLNGANCRHKRFPFIDGVSERTWTDEQLAHIDDGHGCTFEGREYTAYQATQKQRMVERTIRKLKREEKAFKAAGLKEDAQDVRVRIRALNEQYVQFSEAAGLPLQKDRMKVLNTDQAAEEKAAKLRQKRNAESAVREAIKRGDYPLTINQEKQARHMEGTAIPGRSVVTVSLDEVQELINKNAGTGKLSFARNGSYEWKKQETIYAGKAIGFTINREGVKVEAWALKIHYSKTGTHAVPKAWRTKQ